jgi:N-methylhydantoinase A
MHEIADEARKEMEPTGLTEAQTEVTLSTQMCYPGQNFDMSVPVPEGERLDEPGLLDLAERFHDQHKAERGFCFRSQQPLVRGVRYVARGTTPKPDHFAEPGTVTDATQALKGHRPAYFGVDFVDTPVYDGPALGPGAQVEGPALIEEPFTVVVVPPGATARLDDLGNYQLTLP